MRPRLFADMSATRRACRAVLGDGVSEIGLGLQGCNGSGFGGLDLGVWVQGFGVWGFGGRRLGFGIQGFGSGFQDLRLGLGYGVGAQGLETRASGLGLEVSGLGSGGVSLQPSGFGGLGSGFRVSGLGLEVWGSGVGLQASSEEITNAFSARSRSRVSSHLRFFPGSASHTLSINDCIAMFGLASCTGSRQEGQRSDTANALAAQPAHMLCRHGKNAMHLCICAGDRLPLQKTITGSLIRAHCRGSFFKRVSSCRDEGRTVARHIEHAMASSTVDVASSTVLEATSTVRGLRVEG